MKKTTSICLFTGMIFLLLVMVVYLLFTQQDTGEKEQDLAAATEEMPAETDTEKEVKTTESLAVYALGDIIQGAIDPVSSVTGQNKSHLNEIMAVIEFLVFQTGAFPGK